MEGRACTFFILDLSQSQINKMALNVLPVVVQLGRDISVCDKACRIQVAKAGLGSFRVVKKDLMEQRLS